MELTDHEHQVLARMVNHLKTEFAAERIVLFGSAARGDMDRESDIDLLVVLPFVDWNLEKRIGHLAFDAGLEIDRFISTICFSSSELTEDPMRASPLIEAIGREGVAL